MFAAVLASIGSDGNQQRHGGERLNGARPCCQIDATVPPKSERARGPRKTGGHGFWGATRSQRDDETADMWSFLLWQLGAPAFQPLR
jgi:hypothetical protein